MDDMYGHFTIVSHKSGGGGALRWTDARIGVETVARDRHRDRYAFADGSGE
jgi:hypothetical protein